MQRAQPFARAIAMFAAMAACQTRLFSPEQWALAHSSYRSRGHGRNKHSGKGRWNNCTNRLAKLGGQTNGQRECERRRRQQAFA